MARPKKNRLICQAPNVDGFNISRKKNELVELTIDEYETIRLIDNVKLTQSECAKQMRVARSTIAAVYDSARYKLSDSLINNRGIKIVTEGIDFELCENSKHCCGNCGKNRCGRCKHGSCDRCIGIFHPPGEECYVVQFN